MAAAAVPVEKEDEKGEAVGDEDSWSEEDEDDDGEDLKDFIEDDEEGDEEEDELDSDESLDETQLTPAEREELEAIRWLHAACDNARRGRLGRQ